MNSYAASCQNKCKDIQQLVDKLAYFLEPQDYSIIDHWDADLCAIGIGKPSDPRFLVYISVYGQKPGYYYFECEIPVTSGNYQVIDRGENVDFSSLILIIKEHIDSHSVIQPQPA